MTYKPDPKKEVSEETIFEWFICVAPFPLLLNLIMLIEIVSSLM